MSSSLIPERPLLISPTLAATIGLEEAVMLHVISELQLQRPAIFRNQRKWTELNEADLINAMPFWNINLIRKYQQSLIEKGLLRIEALPDKTSSTLFAINQAHQASTDEGHYTVATTARTAYPQDVHRVLNSTPQSGGQASIIAHNWQPGEDLIEQCLQRNIPRDFLQQRVKGFVMYWQERRKPQYSWHHTFLKYIVREWEKERSYKGARELETDISSKWRPSEDAMSILLNAGISASFIEDAIPEFVLYWRERGLVTSTWNTKFIAHIRRQWSKFSAALEHDNTPRLIPHDYEPSPACFEVLAMANIDEDFARQQIAEFVLYWQDRKEACQSWNTRFLQHVKYKWAQHLQSSLPANQQLESTIERFTDRSWAE